MNKRRIENFNLLDDIVLEDHLEKMAGKGWFLLRMETFCWVYEKREPAKVRYEVRYSSDGSDFEPRPTQQQEQMYEESEEHGWKFVAAKGKMHVFIGDSQSIPTESDPVIRYERMHTAARESLLPTQVALLVLCLVNLWQNWGMYADSPSKTFLDKIIPFTWLVLLLMMSYQLVEYLVWNERWKVAIGQGKCNDNSWYKIRSGVNCGGFLVILVLFIMEMIIVAAKGHGRIVAMCIGLLVFGIAAGLGAKNLMKKLQVPSKINQAVTLLITFCAIIFMSMLMIRYSFS